MVSRADPAIVRNGRRGPEELRGDPRAGNWLQPERRGMAVHRLIGGLAARRPCSGETIPRVVTAVLASCRTDSPALRATLRRYGKTWLEHFDPPSGWRFLGAEIAAEHVRFDLVWRDAGRGVWVDEVKAGSVSRAVGQQVAAELAVSRDHYGSCFSGLRVVVLDLAGCVVFDRNGALIPR